MLELKLFLIAILSLPTTLIAGLLIEPYAGIGSFSYKGSVKYDGNNSTLSSSTLRGPMYGGRLAWGMADYGLGVDYTQGKLNDGGETSDLTNLAAIGMCSFAPFRLWLGYIVKSSRTIKNSDYDIDSTIEGSGFKVGVAWFMSENISINAEYITVKYSKEDSRYLSELSETDSGLLLSMSFPFVIF
jgi:hypothetical protein